MADQNECERSFDFCQHLLMHEVIIYSDFVFCFSLEFRESLLGVGGENELCIVSHHHIRPLYCER